jgi:hypothetical protein
LKYVAEASLPPALGARSLTDNRSQPNEGTSFSARDSAPEETYTAHFWPVATKSYKPAPSGLYVALRVDTNGRAAEVHRPTKNVPKKHGPFHWPLYTDY